MKNDVVGDWHGLWRNPVVRGVFAIVAAYFTYDYSSCYLAFDAQVGSTLTAVGATASSGFVAGAIESGNIQGGLQGAFTAVAFYGVGDYLNGTGVFAGGDSPPPGEWSTQGVALHGVVGCVSSVMSGSKCGPGFLSAAFSQAVPASWKGNDPLTGTLSSMVIGGTASVLGGGKFANGAETAAMGYLFNYCMHAGGCNKWQNGFDMYMDQYAKSNPVEIWAFNKFLSSIPDYVTINSNSIADVYVGFGNYLTNEALDNIQYQVAAQEQKDATIFSFGGNSIMSWLKFGGSEYNQVSSMSALFQETQNIVTYGPAVVNVKNYVAAFGSPPHPWSAYGNGWTPYNSN